MGEGTGLGLAFVQGVARHAGGFVTVDSALQQGTTVTVYLPSSDGRRRGGPRRPQRRRRGGAGPRRRHDLVVEDEAAVRRLAVRMLERAGYTVLAASTPSEACAIFAADPARINLLVTDIVMPEMHGQALAKRLWAERPGLRVLFVSGYTGTMPGAGLDDERASFLAKPFTAAELTAAVQGALVPATSE